MQQTRQNTRGFTFVEVCVACVTLAVLLAQAVPAMKRFQQRQRLQGIAQTLMTDLQQARSEAVQRADVIQLRFSQHPQGSCYVMHRGAAGQCRCSDEGQAVCDAPGLLLKTQWVPSSRSASIRANVGNLSFQAAQGAVSPTGSIDVASADGAAIRHIISIAGRVRSCSPDGGFSQLPRCA